MASAQWKYGEVSHVIRESRVIFRDTYCTVRIRPYVGPVPLKQSRLLISIPRKIGSAPQRNRYKRQLRDIVFRLQKRFPLSGDLLIFVRKPFPPNAYHTLFAAIEQVLLKPSL